MSRRRPGERLTVAAPSILSGTVMHKLLYGRLPFARYFQYFVDEESRSSISGLRAALPLAPMKSADSRLILLTGFDAPIVYAGLVRPGLTCLSSLLIPNATVGVPSFP